MEEHRIAFQYEPKKINFRTPIKFGICNACQSVNVSRIATYTPDFFLVDYNLWVETKGRWDSAGRTKILAVLDTSGSLTRENFRMLFMYDNWVTKKRKQTYLKWCERHEIVAAVGKTIPKEWLK